MDEIFVVGSWVNLRTLSKGPDNGFESRKTRGAGL